MANNMIVLERGAHGGLKSIPLNALPEAAWRSVLGSTGDGGGVVDLYKRVPWLYRAVEIRANTMAAMPYVWTNDRGDETDKTPDLPFAVSVPALLNTIEGWLTLYGAAYLWKGLNPFGIPKELRPLHPTSIKPDISRTDGLRGFKRAAGDGSMDMTLDELAYIWLPSRDVEVGPGYAPVNAALHAAGVVGGMDGLLKMFLDNGIISPTVITVDGNAAAQEIEKLETWVQRALGGVKNAFRAIGLRSGVSVHQLATVMPDKLAMRELDEVQREKIATALGVPHSLLFSNAANYATAETDMLSFYEMTIKPDAELIEAALNEQVFARTRWTLKLKPEQIEVYQERETRKAYRVGDLYRSGIVTLNEVRLALGFERVEGGDELLPTPAAAAAAAQATAEAQAAQQAAQAAQFQRDAKNPRAERPAGKRSAPAVGIGGQRGPGGQAGAEIAKEKAAGEAKSAEIDQWERVALRRLREGKPQKSAAFKSSALADDEADWVRSRLPDATDEEAVKTLFEVAALRVNATKDEASYVRSIRALVRGLWRGVITLFDFIDGMYSAIRREYRRAFEEGLAEYGVTWDELTANQRRVLEDAINREALHITNYANAISERDQAAGGKLEPHLERADGWSGRLQSIRDMGRLVAAGDRKLKWQWNEDKEHCDDCARLNGRVYKASTWLRWNIVPGSAKLECFGMWCGCELVETDEPITRGRPPRWLLKWENKTVELDVLPEDEIEVA